MDLFIKKIQNDDESEEKKPETPKSEDKKENSII
jgi:hypothetical protein